MEKSFLKSKKFWAAVIGVTVPILNQVFKLELSVEAVLTITGPIMAFLVGQGIADAKK